MVSERDRLILRRRAQAEALLDRESLSRTAAQTVDEKLRESFALTRFATSLSASMVRDDEVSIPGLWRKLSQQKAERAWRK